MKSTIAVTDIANQVDPALLWDWLAARSLARGLPMPVREHGGMRVDTGTESALRRHVFAGPAPSIRALAASIRTPRIFIKMCGDSADLLATAPPEWQLRPPGYVMTHAGPWRPGAALAPSYRLETTRHGPTVHAVIHAQDGALAASGYAVAHGQAFVFDRIHTHPDHRRRGLGRALMAALAQMQTATDTTPVLVATDDARRLYETLGWHTVSPYSTIVMPE